MRSVYHSVGWSRLAAIQLCSVLFFILLFAVFIIFFKDFEVTLVAAGHNLPLLDRLQNSTLGLVGVGAVIEAALGSKAHKVGEVAGQLLGLNINQSEALDTR